MEAFYWRSDSSNALHYPHGEKPKKTSLKSDINTIYFSIEFVSNMYKWEMMVFEEIKAYS